MKRLLFGILLISFTVSGIALAEVQLREFPWGFDAEKEGIHIGTLTCPNTNTVAKVYQHAVSKEDVDGQKTWTYYQITIVSLQDREMGTGLLNLGTNEVLFYKKDTSGLYVEVSQEQFDAWLLKNILEYLREPGSQIESDCVFKSESQ